MSDESNFCKVQEGQEFEARGTRWRREMRARDYLGGYNARDMETGDVEMFFDNEKVEIPNDSWASLERLLDAVLD